MSTREDPETLLTDRDTQKPREARRRSKKCPVCLTKLVDSCTKTLCATCSAKIMQEEKTSLMAEIRSVVREEVQSSLSDLQPGPSGVTRRSVPAVSESDSDIAENVAFDGEVTQEDKKYLFSTADMDQLLKAVRRTMQVEEDVQQPRTVQEDMFAGLLPQQKSSFPVNATLKQLILNEWESVDQAPLIPREFKERLLFPGDEVSFLDEIPKVDTAIAMVSRKSGLPFEDTSHLKDPLDHKMDTSMRKAWSTSGLIMKANIAATSVARSMAIWLDQFAALVDQKSPREEFASGIPLLRMATGFLADASMETVRLGARMAALSNTARRAVWVKEWSGDAASKNRLCTLPFRGGRIFGPDLDRLLEKAADKSHGLPATRPPKRPFTPHPSSTYAGKGKTGRWSYPKGGRGKTLTFVPQPILSGPVGDRLTRCANSWRSITTNEWVLHLVAEGYRIELLSRPPDRFMITPTQSPGLEQALLEGVRNLQGLGAIIPVPKKEQGKGFYSPPLSGSQTRRLPPHHYQFKTTE
ncbi:lamina-associated polypeptide 2, isoforms alpha/zeta-like [Eleutherodactylus coqui]|uniref:lamina-associated polypeptide 2, isoforms alpha/zeta-like n=1 Tax=Eleutherodactylus coqui TaxID=57060 RepID=UPI003461A53B